MQIQDDDDDDDTYFNMISIYKRCQYKEGGGLFDRNLVRSSSSFQFYNKLSIYHAGIEAYTDGNVQKSNQKDPKSISIFVFTSIYKYRTSIICNNLIVSV